MTGLSFADLLVWAELSCVKSLSYPKLFPLSIRLRLYGATFSSIQRKAEGAAELFFIPDVEFKVGLVADLVAEAL